MKRILSILLCLLMVFGVCGVASAEAKPTLTVMMSSGDFGPDTIKVALGKAAEILGVELAFDVYPDDQFLNVVNTKLATGNAGELIAGIVTNTVKPWESEKLVKLWENAVSLKDLGYINEDYMSATNDMAFEALAEGECAFYAQLDSAYGSLVENYPDAVENLGMMYVLLWDDAADGYVLFGTAINYLSAVKGTANEALAKEFINTMWLTS